MTETRKRKKERKKDRRGGGRRMKRKRRLLPDALVLRKFDDAQILKCRME
jgi:hypothetical protein